jgi:hypothetical protein
MMIMIIVGMVYVAFNLCLYFVSNNSFIRWDQFSENATIYNPRGSCAILPKIITDQDKVDRTSFSDFNKKKVVFLRK